MLELQSTSALPCKQSPPRKRKRDEFATIETTPALSAEIDANEQQKVNTVATLPCFTNDAFSSTPKKLIGRRRIVKDHNIRIAQRHYLETKPVGKSVLSQQPPVNPFEVLRAPKKKIKHENACFENEGLNLQLPEKQFNPYEVIRTPATPSKCFVNKGLNLRGGITPASLNPYEIQRQNGVSIAASSPNGIENPALVEEALPTSLKIGLPFVPTVGCRIDFNRLSITPSTDSVRKLGISPVEATKCVLGSITEETTIDIGKELDRYQLELENSINEAKMRKKEIPVNVETNSNAAIKEPSAKPVQLTKLSNPGPETVEKVLHSFDANADVAYASDSDEENELDFKTTGNFVRAYHPAVVTNIQHKDDKMNSLNSFVCKKPSKLTEGIVVNKLIRKSFRKLLHPMQTHKAPKNALQEKSHHSIMKNIRHSLRRCSEKKNRHHESEKSLPVDISIVDSSERTMKLRSCVSQTEYMRIEQLTNERKHTLRNSIRHSTRDVLRHVFNKSQGAYATEK